MQNQLQHSLEWAIAYRSIFWFFPPIFLHILIHWIFSIALLVSGLISPFPCQYPKVSAHLHAVSCLCWWRQASSAKSIITIHNKTTQHFQWHGLTVALAQHHVFTEPHPKAGIPNLVFPCIYSIIHRISATLEGTTLSIPLRHPFKTEFESVNALNMFSIRSSTEQVQTKQLGIYRCPRII